MSSKGRQIFLLNGTQKHWIVGKTQAVWGLPLKGLKWNDAKALLQDLNFIAGCEVLAISGPYAHFRAVIGSDRGVYFDDQPVLWLGPGNELYPVRIELTDIQDINDDWYTGPRGEIWRGVLEDVYFKKKSLYVLQKNAVRHPDVAGNVIMGH